MRLGLQKMSSVTEKSSFPAGEYDAKRYHGKISLEEIGKLVI